MNYFQTLHATAASSYELETQCYLAHMHAVNKLRKNDGKLVAEVITILSGIIKNERYTLERTYECRDTIKC
jgi:hypothetical protein